jgi:hypothetical protein
LAGGDGQLPQSDCTVPRARMFRVLAAMPGLSIKLCREWGSARNSRERSAAKTAEHDNGRS